MDVAIVWNPGTFSGDWGIGQGDLLQDPGGLRSAVLLSLFTDRRAPASFVPPPGSKAEVRGHFSDTYEGFELGSWLWLLNRAIKSDEVTLLVQTQDYCMDALQWLVDAKIVGGVSVQTGWISPDTIGIGVTITQPQSPPETFQFAWAWQGA